MVQILAGVTMTFVITSACIDVMDQSCVEVCPVDCIYIDPEDRMCYVHPDECIDCAVCEAACPVAAIFAENQVPSEESKFTAINALWFEDKTTARTAVAEFLEDNPGIA
jgi:NAD-dependent dihydropyrimidine dehydrogenase PreA subunit